MRNLIPMILGFFIALCFLESATNASQLLVSLKGCGGGDCQNDVYVYNENGTWIGSALDLRDLPTRFVQTRQIIFGPDGNLYVAIAGTGDHSNANILVFNGTPETSGRRQNLRTFTKVDSETNPGMLHPFGIAFSTHLVNGTTNVTSVFVSAQETNTVLRYYMDGTPQPLPSLKEFHDPTLFAPGTFVAPESIVGKDHAGLKSVRGIVVGPDGLLYAVDKDKSRIRRYDSQTGRHIDEITDPSLKDPIHILFSPSGDKLFITSLSSNEIFVWHRFNNTVTTFVSAANNGGLDGPSGMAFRPGTDHDGFLYVGSRRGRQVLRFSLADGSPDPNGPFISDMPDGPEFLLFQNDIAYEHQTPPKEYKKILMVVGILLPVITIMGMIGLTVAFIWYQRRQQRLHQQYTSVPTKDVLFDQA